MDLNKPGESFPERVFLIGMPAAGKSLVGKRLAQRIGYYFIDLDQLIEQQSGEKVAAIFKKKGEDYFRQIEQKALRSLDSLREVVIATGGGTPCFYNNMQWMKTNGYCIFINPSIDTILRRLDNEKSDHRPLLQRGIGSDLRSTLERLYRERKPIYSEAQLAINREDFPMEEVLKRMAEANL